MKKLTLIVSIIFAANIFSAPAAPRQKFEMPAGKISLPIDDSVNNWCVDTESNHTFSNEVLL